jgi:predicted GNAT superfamily acetyltransferase
MRTFEKFLYRRRIMDIKQYFINKGITTNLLLAEWCKQHSIEAPSTPIFRDGISSPKEVAPEDVSKKTWHVPAAERPLRKSAVTKKSNRQKKKGSK